MLANDKSLHELTKLAYHFKGPFHDGIQTGLQKKFDNSLASGKFSRPIRVAEKLAKRFP